MLPPEGLETFAVSSTYPGGSTFRCVVSQAHCLAPVVMESAPASPFGLYRGFTRFGLPILHFSGIVISEYRKMLQTEGIYMMYRTVAAGYAHEAGEMAAKIERAANEYARKGWEPVTFSVINSAKAIPVFRVPEESDNEKG